MLIVNFINTLPNRKDEEIMFDELSQGDERSKRTDEEKILNQNKCALVPKFAVVRKEEGATAAASHLPSPWRNSAGWSRKGRTGRDSPRRFFLQERPIKYHKCPTFDTKRERDFQSSDGLSKSEQMNKKMQLSLTERSDLNIRMLK